MNLICDKPLGKGQLQSAKKQFCNQLQMAEENKNALMVYHGKSLLLYNHIEKLETYLNKIQQLDSSMLQEVANEVLPFKELSQLLFIPEK